MKVAPTVAPQRKKYGFAAVAANPENSEPYPES